MRFAEEKRDHIMKTMMFPSQIHVVPRALPVDGPQNPDANARTTAEIFETLAFKLYHTALRFEDDGVPHIPTYGLRLAADEFSRAAFCVFRESLPLPVPIKASLVSHVRAAAIGLRAFASSLEHDWDLVKSRCGAHCKLCTSRCNAHQIDVLRVVLEEMAQQRQLAQSDRIRLRDELGEAGRLMESYAQHVLSSRSFQNSEKYWSDYADYWDKIGDWMQDLL